MPVAPSRRSPSRATGEEQGWPAQSVTSWPRELANDSHDSGTYAGMGLGTVLRADCARTRTNAQAGCRPGARHPSPDPHGDLIVERITQYLYASTRGPRRLAGGLLADIQPGRRGGG